MSELLWIIPALPFAGFLVLAVFGSRMPRSIAGAIGAGTVGLSAAAAITAAVQFIAGLPAQAVYTRTLWTWLSAAGFSAGITLYLDALSLCFVLVITFVGFLIHLYSTEFMIEEEGYSRFFAYMNLFVGSMLVLVLADNLLLLYLGWEGVGLCSYLLIGFWYKEPANGLAACKAFVITRVGDTAMALGVFLLFTSFGTLGIQELMGAALKEWAVGSTLPVAAAALLLGGAMGKSAQLPLQTWLPDAMAGPSPVSALIHAATMVTAGVYLIARAHVLFDLAPQVKLAVAITGAVTLLVAGTSALAQEDIKRVLAYSTISQIGYMFLALGVGAWAGAVFHFVTHAFFKALLFLAAGAVIHVLHHEHNIFKMGGLRKKIPIVFWTFLIGAASLSALPLVTAGFYSKDLILWHAWNAPGAGMYLWSAGMAGAFITSIYSFRLVFIVFFGEPHTEIEKRPGRRMTAPLIVLAALSIAGGFIELPETMGHITLFSGLIKNALPVISIAEPSPGLELMLQIDAAVASLAGLLLAYLLFLRVPSLMEKFRKSKIAGGLSAFLFSGWGFDRLYDALLVRPFTALARANRDDIIDLPYRSIAALTCMGHMLASRTQNGKLRWYALGIALGAAIIITMAVFS